MNLGLFYIIIAQFLWATELIIVRKFFPNLNSITLSAIGSIIGSIFYLPSLFVFKEKINSRDWLILFIYAFTSWFLAQIFYIRGIQKGINAFTITLTTLFFPFFAVVLASIFLKEALTLKIIIGGIIMTIGFLIISL